VGLAGIFLVVNVITGSYVPALSALAERLGIVRPVVDVGWSVAGFGWGWPGAVGVVLGTVAASILLILVKGTKCLWTDIWSLWHSQVIAAMVWGVTGSVPLGIGTAVVYNIVVMKLADWTAEANQEFHQMPGITIPCGYVSVFGYLSQLLAPVLRSIPGIKDVDASPEAIRDRLGVFGEMSVLGAVIGVIIGIAAGYNFAGTLTLALDTALLLVLLPRMVAVLMEGITPVAGAVRDWLIDTFEDREIHVAVDCAVQLGHPAVMASAIIVMPLAILATTFLPGYSFIIIASLAGIPYMCGAIVAHTKGNVLHTVILALVFQIIFMYGASLPMISGAYTATADKLGLLEGLVSAGQQITAPDPGGGFLGLLMFWLGSLLG
jgi:PTS system galactitol-specific IIC component